MMRYPGAYQEFMIGDVCLFEAHKLGVMASYVEPWVNCVHNYSSRLLKFCSCYVHSLI